MIAVPATPASDDRASRTARTRGSTASTKKPPRRSSAPNRTRKFAACRPGRPVAERDRRDQQREPAQLQREQELRDELAAVRIRRPERRDDRLAGEDQHVADLLEQRSSSARNARSATARTISSVLLWTSTEGARMAPPNRTGYGTKVAHAKREPLSFCEGNTQVYIPMGSGRSALSPYRRTPVRAVLCSRRRARQRDRSCEAPRQPPRLSRWRSPAAAVGRRRTPSESATYSVAIPVAIVPGQAAPRRARRAAARRAQRGHAHDPQRRRDDRDRRRRRRRASSAFGARLDERARLALAAGVDRRRRARQRRHRLRQHVGARLDRARRDARVHLGVVPVRAGSYTLRYRLTGSTTAARSCGSGGGAPRGSFTVHVSGKPAQVRVTPDGESSELTSRRIRQASSSPVRVRSTPQRLRPCLAATASASSRRCNTREGPQRSRHGPSRCTDRRRPSLRRRSRDGARVAGEPARLPDRRCSAQTVAAASGCDWSVSSPDSPVRMR